MDRYEPLTRYLEGCREPSLSISFKEVENIIGRTLPASAYKHQPWWANTTTHSHALSWMRAGWKTGDVNLNRRTVRFARSDGPPRVGGTSGAKAASGRPADLTIDPAQLSAGALRMLQDYCESESCEMGAAVVNILNDLALRRRRQLIDWVRANAAFVPGDSTDIIREARDAR
jgi:hypothetical protein